MTKATQIWDLDKKRRFFQSHLSGIANLDAKAADKLSQTLAKAINMMRVWEMPSTASSSSEPDATTTTSSTVKQAEAQTKPKFDPYAFSLMVVFAKSGKDELLKRLNEIDSLDNLRALAHAQHLAVDQSIEKLDALRQAMADAAEKRLADRKAAAS